MTGSVTISIELELAWGHHDKGGSDICSRDRSAEEEYLNRLLAVCDRWGLPFTFDVVGHLLLEECDGTHGGSYKEGWFDGDPGTDADRDPLFYWPQVPSLLREREVDHELSTHTFSHVLCDETDDETVANELELCRTLHREHGFEAPRTVVTPRHRTASREVLRNAGIEGVRTPKRRPQKTLFGRYLQRANYWTRERGHPTYEPRWIDGIVELYTTPYPSLTAVHLPNGRLPPQRLFRGIPLSVRQRFQRSYLDGAMKAAARSESNVHLWTHLYNLSNSAQWAVIASFLEDLGRAQRDGNVEVLTMADLVDQY